MKLRRAARLAGAPAPLEQLDGSPFSVSAQQGGSGGLAEYYARRRRPMNPAAYAYALKAYASAGNNNHGPGAG